VENVLHRLILQDALYGTISHMMLLHEMAVFAGGIVEIELHEDLSYRLRFGQLVEYENGYRKIQKKVFPYAFRSVEQLRYDFERDVAAQGESLG
jgi:hypothetical protein